MITGRVALTACAAAWCACACGAEAATTPPVPHPEQGLVTLADMQAPGFSTVDAMHTLTAAQVAAGGATAERLRADGFSAAWSTRLFRAVDPALSNGPFDIVSTVVMFSAGPGAQDAIGAEDAAIVSAPGASAVSAGVIGDVSYAVEETRSTAQGVRLLQVTLLWRVANVFEELVARGRDGGMDIASLTAIAQRQAARLLRG